MKYIENGYARKTLPSRYLILQGCRFCFTPEDINNVGGDDTSAGRRELPAVYIYSSVR